MKEIWAPWRIEYIRASRQNGCFLCKSLASRRDRHNLVLHRGKTCIVIMNRYPYTGGHLMVAPRRHVDSLHAMTTAEVHEMMRLTRKAISALKRIAHPQGFNVGINIGAAAGAGLKDHIHLHIVPRWIGDTNFMPVLAHVKVVPQALLGLWDELRVVFRK
jgi:ATP adenylyltransferase